MRTRPSRCATFQSIPIGQPIIRIVPQTTGNQPFTVRQIRIRRVGLEGPKQPQRSLTNPVLHPPIAGGDQLLADRQADVAMGAQVLRWRVIVRIIRPEPALPNNLDVKRKRIDPTS
jgi:hypothetical protein